jgi:hypothetical protein
MGVPSRVGSQVNVRVRATVLPRRRANFEYSGRAMGFIDQMMAIGITAPERRAISHTQCFFAGVCNQRELTLKHPDEFLLMAVPVALAGP